MPENIQPKKRGRPVRTGPNAEPAKVEVDKMMLDNLLASVIELQRKDAENQKQLAMLSAVADKGRVFNYENLHAEKKPIRVRLSKYGGGIIVGWRTVKDELVKHPTTGLIVGEVQEYELLVQNDAGEIEKKSVLGYPAFSAARYDDRIEAEVMGRREDYEGKITFDAQLPNGSMLSISSQFVN